MEEKEEGVERRVMDRRKGKGREGGGGGIITEWREGMWMERKMVGRQA